jgi:hypothetical protein
MLGAHAVPDPGLRFSTFEPPNLHDDMVSYSSPVALSRGLGSAFGNPGLGCAHSWII